MRRDSASRDGRRPPEDFRGSRRVHERKAKGDAMVRRDTEPPRRTADDAPPHVAILLLGLSGVGKSTFISHLTRERMKIGHSLTSCTKDVDGYIYIRPNGQRVYLLDTPGFDDTEKDNISVLHNIAMILYTLYDSRCLSLAGVLYLHRISDVRMAGSSIKSIRLFEKMCGEGNFGAVAVVTTMWELVELELAGTREQSLVSTPEFFGGLNAGGASIIRHLNTFDSAVNIVEHMLRKQRTVVLDIQKEMVIERKSLKHTAAGRYLQGEFEQTRARYERELEQLQEALEEATQEDDEDLITMISEQRKEYEENIRNAELAQGQLSATPEQLEQQQLDWFSQRAEQEDSTALETEEKTPREIELEEQLARAEREHIRELNKLRLVNKGKDVENEQLKREHRLLKETVKEQLQRERAEREKKGPREELAEVMDQGFFSLMRKALGLDTTFVQPLRRALTYPREEKALKQSRGPKPSESKSRASSQHRKLHKRQRDRPPPEDDTYDEPDDGFYSGSSLDESPAAHRGSYSAPYIARTSVAPSRQQQVQPGFENVKYVEYAVDSSSYSRQTASIALTRAYPSSDQRR